MACLARNVAAPAHARRTAAPSNHSVSFTRGTFTRQALPLSYVDFTPVTPYDQTELTAPIQRTLAYDLSAPRLATYDGSAPLVRVDDKNIDQAVGDTKKAQKAYEANADQTEDRTAKPRGTESFFDVLGKIFGKK